MASRDFDKMDKISGMWFVNTFSGWIKIRSFDRKAGRVCHPNLYHEEKIMPIQKLQFRVGTFAGFLTKCFFF